MRERLGICAVVLATVVGFPAVASADWLLTGFAGALSNVKTKATDSFPGETFKGSRALGVNLASAFAKKGNAGFELDWGVYNKALADSDRFGSEFASKLMAVSTNLFYSPAIPRYRPYITVGPTFTYRSDREENRDPLEGGWAVGFNAGGGLIAFLNEYVGGRIDVRYTRNIGDFVALTSVGDGGQLWNNLSYWRVVAGATVVLR